MNIHFLHGFLGFGSDWFQFSEKFQPHKCFFHNIEDYLPLPNCEKNYFNEWATNFNQSVFSKFESEKNILIGYSLGGRLALHSLRESNKWNGIVIISANPGLTNELDKTNRINNDKKWADRFLKEDWETVMTSWNSQGVFSGKKNTLTREEKDYSREKISEVLQGFSLGKQDNLRDLIISYTKPLVWISGEQDVKFAEIARELHTLNQAIPNHIIANAGHRIPWEEPEQFLEICNKFISNIR